jgi:hypothetical protein
MFGERPLYHIDAGLESRSISFENPTGARGAGGRAASPLGVGRKGDAVRTIAAGETVVLADIAGRGTIRHIWATTLAHSKLLRGAVVRATWDDQVHPSIELPLGEFFGFAHGVTNAFESEAHSVGERYGMNSWLPMPFTKRARITLTNESHMPFPLFYQIDYTLNDAHAEDVGRLHALFRRSNPTTLGQDFEVLPRREGRGRYLGAVIGVRPLKGEWWGEGEAKIYLDGDQEFATIVGTGAEDYICLSFGVQRTPFRFHGASYMEKGEGIETGRVSMYRWHMLDPIFFQRDIRVTIQQIGLGGETPRTLDEYKARFVERQDDWSAAAFWYEAAPSAPLPVMPDLAARVADLP